MIHGLCLNAGSRSTSVSGATLKNRNATEGVLHTLKSNTCRLSCGRLLVQCYIQRFTRTNRRWEFDRRKLFRQTEYMVSVCQKLEVVVEVIDQFKRFLGPRLRAVTRSHRALDELSAKAEVCFNALVKHV